MLEKVEAPYYMFCDQDDVWLPEKIELSFQEMTRQEAAAPGQSIVVHTDLHIVDEQLTVTYDSMWKHCGLYPQYIKTFADTGGHTSVATGCTMLFNHKAKEGCKTVATKAIMHDCWLSLCTLRCGGIVRGIHQPTVLYRQHKNNCLGSGATQAADVTLLFRLRHLDQVYESNRNYYLMLRSLGYGSILKYFYGKIKYKQRIKRGHY
jgi:rhamnosyltransferase